MLSQLRKLKASTPDHLLSILPSLQDVDFEPHDWPDYIPYRLHVGTFYHPTEPSELPVWAYLRIRNNARAVSMELGAHRDLGGDDELNWELFYGNIQSDDNARGGKRFVRLHMPFKVERSRNELCALVKYYFLLCADAGLLDGSAIPFNESFAVYIRHICRRIVRLGTCVSALVARSTSPLLAEGGGLREDAVISEHQTPFSTFSRLEEEATNSHSGICEHWKSVRCYMSCTRTDSPFCAINESSGSETGELRNFREGHRSVQIKEESLESRESLETRATFTSADCPTQDFDSSSTVLYLIHERSAQLTTRINSLYEDIAQLEAKKRDLDEELGSFIAPARNHSY